MGLIENSNRAKKIQEELKELELQQQEVIKQKSSVAGKSQKIKSDMQKYSSRVEALDRNQQMNNAQLRNIRN